MGQCTGDAASPAQNAAAALTTLTTLDLRRRTAPGLTECRLPQRVLQRQLRRRLHARHKTLRRKQYAKTCSPMGTWETGAMPCPFICSGARRMHRRMQTRREAVPRPASPGSAITTPAGRACPPARRSARTAPAPAHPAPPATNAACATPSETCSTAGRWVASRNLPLRLSGRRRVRRSMCSGPPPVRGDDAAGVQPRRDVDEQQGQRVRLRALGAGCGNGDECMSGNCVDGVCCGRTHARAPACLVWTSATGGGNGRCRNIRGGGDPNNECSDGTCRTGTEQRQRRMRHGPEWSTGCRMQRQVRLAMRKAKKAADHCENGQCVSPSRVSCRHYGCDGSRCRTSCPSGTNDTGSQCAQCGRSNQPCCSPLDGLAKRTDWFASPTETIRMTVDASTAETKVRAAAQTEGATAPPSAPSMLAWSVGAHSIRAAMARRRVARVLATALDSFLPASRDDRSRYRHGREHFVTAHVPVIPSGDPCCGPQRTDPDGLFTNERGTCPGGPVCTESTGESPGWSARLRSRPKYRSAGAASAAHRPVNSG